MVCRNERRPKIGEQGGQEMSLGSVLINPGSICALALAPGHAGPNRLSLAFGVKVGPAATIGTELVSCPSHQRVACWIVPRKPGLMRTSPTFQAHLPVTTRSWTSTSAADLGSSTTFFADHGSADTLA